MFPKLTTTFILICCSAFVVTAGPMCNAESPFGPHPRPKITGISHISVYSSDLSATDHYYSVIIGAAREADPENSQGKRYAINATQFVEVLPLPGNAGVNRLDHVGWKTDNVEAMRVYLASKSWKTPARVQRFSDGSKAFRVVDPEGNQVEFVEPPANAKAVDEPNVIGHHIIHVGFLVHSREAEDKFYKDLLGFKPYWFGGMEEGKIDWVSQQTPDSHDWLEYMLTSGPSGSGIPNNISQRSLGVLDHLSVGVVSVPDTYKKLAADDRLPKPGDKTRADKQPNIGKDGKYQFNLYDPDGVRLELMNFRATDKPCCSPFTADDPKPE